MLVAIYVVSDTRGHFFLAVALGLPGSFGIWYNELFLHQPALGLPGVLSLFLFYGYAISLILYNITKTDRITAETIYAAVSIYLLIGIAFAIAYAFLQFIQPGSFAVDAAHNPDGKLTFTEFIYLSFVTLTTLGYGDITPVGKFARSLSVVQSVLGVLYIAVLISRFVGIYIAQSIEKDG